MRSLSRRQVLGGAVATAAAATLGAPAVHAQKGHRTLRFVAQADLHIVDPVWTVPTSRATTDISSTTLSLAATSGCRSSRRWWELPPPDFIPKIEQNPMLRTFVYDPLGQQGWLRPNHLHPPFNNRKAREALLHMMDQVTYLALAIGQSKYYRTCYSVFACGGSYAAQRGAEPMMKHDLGRARQLVKEAGYDGRPIVVIHVTDQPLLKGAGPVTQRRLESIGFNVDLRAMDWATAITVRARRDPPTREAGTSITPCSRGLT